MILYEINKGEGACDWTVGMWGAWIGRGQLWQWQGMGRCRLDFVGGELVRWDKWGAVKGGILFGMEKNHNLQWQIFAVLEFCFLLSMVLFDWYNSWFVGLIFERQHSESPYSESVTGTETVFTKRTLVGQLFVMNCHTELHENRQSVYSPISSDRRTDWQPAVFCTKHFVISKRM